MITNKYEAITTLREIRKISPPTTRHKLTSEILDWLVDCMPAQVRTQTQVAIADAQEFLTKTTEEVRGSTYLVVCIADGHATIHPDSIVKLALLVMTTLMRVRGPGFLKEGKELQQLLISESRCLHELSHCLISRPLSELCQDAWFLIDGWIQELDVAIQHQVDKSVLTATPLSRYVNEPLPQEKLDKVRFPYEGVYRK